MLRPRRSIRGATTSLMPGARGLPPQARTGGRPVYEAAGNRLALGTVFNSLGRLYRAHGRLDEALAFQMKALALHEREEAGFELMQSLNAVGAVQSMLGHTAVARGLLSARARARGEVFVAADSGLPSREHRGTLDR